MNDQAASPEQLEREIAATRAAIDHKLELLQRRVAPRRIAGQMAGAVAAHGGVFARNLTATLRDNPVPVALVVIGICWLMVAGRNGRHAADAVPALPEPAVPEAVPEPAPEPAAVPRTAAALAAAESAAESDAERPAAAIRG